MFLFDAAAKALRSLGFPDILMIILGTILVTLLCLTSFVVGASVLAFHLSSALGDSWAGEAIRWGGSIGSAVLAWMLFPGIMPLIVSFFGTKISAVIDRHDYPDVPAGAPPAFWPQVLHDVGFGIKAVMLNLICLPLYLVPGVNLFLFYVLNGYLLGREFFMLAARRYLPFAEAERLRRAHGWMVFTGGILLAFLATIPLINLIAPVWGIALATHLFHQAYGAPRLTPLTDGR